MSTVTIYICPRCDGEFHSPGVCPKCNEKLEATKSIEPVKDDGDDEQEK